MFLFLKIYNFNKFLRKIVCEQYNLLVSKKDDFCDFFGRLCEE